MQVIDLKDHIGFFIQATSSYFKSSEPSLRKAAALLIGKLVLFLQVQHELYCECQNVVLGNQKF